MLRCPSQLFGDSMLALLVLVLACLKWCGVVSSGLEERTACEEAVF